MMKTLKKVSFLIILKILGALIGLVYSILQVRYFGASGIVDSYFVATAALYLITSLNTGRAISLKYSFRNT